MISRQRWTSSRRAFLSANLFGLVVGILGGACLWAAPPLVQLLDDVPVPSLFLAGLVCGVAIGLVAPRLLQALPPPGLGVAKLRGYPSRAWSVLKR